MAKVVILCRVMRWMRAKFPAKAPMANAPLAGLRVTAEMMMGVIRGCMRKPRGSDRGLGIGVMLRPSSLAMSSIGREVATPVKKLIADKIAPLLSVGSVESEEPLRRARRV